MQSWIWILGCVLALALATISILKYISVQKYKRHIEYLKKSMRMNREELGKMATEKQYLEKEMDVVKNIYRNKLISLDHPENETKKIG
jgi:predicted outer membrane lipoprotein